ncbi:MAG: hypothetical protein WBP45_11190 [Daejeonella sp.]
MSEERKCLDCNELVRGRTDKKFCNDQCRNNYNNRLNSTSGGLVRHINNVLRRNRRILEELNPEGKTKVLKKKLVSKGFDFEHITSLYHTKTGKTYFFCYELGYLMLDELEVLLVKREDQYK